MFLYLAGPMRGYPNGNKAVFEMAAAQLRNQGHYVFNPAENKAPVNADGMKLRMSMATDTSWICLVAEAVALLPGWRESLGALAEYHLAKSIGIGTYEIVDQDLLILT